MSDPGFFVVKGPGAPTGPGPARRPDGGPSYPPPTGPPRGPPRGPLPGPPPGLAHGMNHGHPHGPQHGPQQGPPGGPPHLQRNTNPVDLRGGPAIQISDVSQDLLSESDMKEELTEHVVFRYEKMADKNAFDDHGRPKWPSWEKAIRTEDRSIPKQVAAEKIRQLNRHSKSVIDKKGSLTAPLKRQIDLTLEYLMSQETDQHNYQWVLAQIDHQLKPLDTYLSNGLNNQYESPRGHRSPTHRSSGKRKSHLGIGTSSSTSRHPKKMAYERVSLTAYFTRVPRSGVDVVALWNDKRRELQGPYQQHQHPVNRDAFHQMLPNPNQFQGAQGGRNQNRPPSPHRVPQGFIPTHNGPHPGIINKNGHPHTRNNQGQKTHGAQKGTKHNDSDSDSDSHSVSSDSSSSGTRPSSVSDHHDRGHHKNHTNARGQNNTRLHPHHHNNKPMGSTHPSTPKNSVASHIERIRDEAYRRGRLAERSENLIAEELAQSKIHPLSGPRILREVSPSPPRVFRVRTDMDDIPRQFTRLSVYDEDDGVTDAELRRENARRRREYEQREQRGSILSDDPFERSLSPSSYTYSSDGRRRGPPIREIPERYPLSPGPRRGRVYY